MCMYMRIYMCMYPHTFPRSQQLLYFHNSYLCKSKYCCATTLNAADTVVSTSTHKQSHLKKNRKSIQSPCLFGVNLSTLGNPVRTWIMIFTLSCPRCTIQHPTGKTQLSRGHNLPVLHGASCIH